MSFSSSDDDSQQRFALGFLFALITLIVATVIGVVVYQRGFGHGQQATSMNVQMSPGAPVPVVEDVASVVVINGVVTFYFASASAELANGANDALATIVQGVGDGKRASVSGFHDATGDVERNAALAKARAQAVLTALLSLGVDSGKVELKKPEKTQAEGSNAQARRVEVILID